MQKLASFAILVALLALPARADAQMGRWLGAAVSAAGAAMLLMDPDQPAQPGTVSRDTLISDTISVLADPAFFAEQVIAVDPDAARVACTTRLWCGIYVAGATNGAIVGGGTAIGIATSNGRTVYAGTLAPYEERSAGLKYGGAAMVIGGALMATLWPNQPAMQNVSVTPSRGGGVRAAKTITW